ncbi:hypothetical protein HYT02_05915 [Candidatus Gottesmanbacteria bacterium]|nr:hypothetical protein [Candidatus Gottesmanbacteria bacterium]
MKENNENNAPIIISLGGSLIYPRGGIDTDFLTKFRKFILDQVSQGKKFFIICGGGSITRQYQKIASEVMKNTPDDDLDWLGTHATRLW